MRGISGETLRIHSIGTSISGDSQIIIADNNAEDWYLNVATTDSLKVLEQISLPPYLAYHPATFLMHPRSNTLYFSYIGNPFAWISGVVYSMDLSTLELSVILDENDIGRFMANDMLLTPESDYLYILTARKLVKMRLSDNTISIPIDRTNLQGVAMTLNPIDYAE
jgi:hypothetical protein